MAANFVDRISSLDSSYLPGDLSIFPHAQDSSDTLYRVANNGETVLTQSFSYGASFLVVNDTSKFPIKGLLRVGLELIYYDSKTLTVFSNLKRGFAGSRQSPWPAGTSVTNSVMAEPHNAVKDALINMEHDLGLAVSPAPASLNGLLTVLENRFLSPKPVFRAWPRKGNGPLSVTFQNFSLGSPNRFLWDFGDGATSTDMSPIHQYTVNGSYTVVLNMITSLGAQGVITKTDYITLGDTSGAQFFYATPLVGTTATTFNFVDQTMGPVTTRHWMFGDGNATTETDPNIHYTTHQYTQTGSYSPSLLVEFSGGSGVNLSLGDVIVVS